MKPRTPPTSATVAVVLICTLVCAMATFLCRTADAATRVAVAPDGIGREGDRFGASVAMYGDTAAIGIPQAQPTPFIKSGAIEVLRKGAHGWEHEALLEPPILVNSLGFGTSLGVAQDMIVAVAGNIICTYLRHGSQWTLHDQFVIWESGLRISLSGNTLVASTQSGMSALVLMRVDDQWVRQTLLEGAYPEEQIMDAAIDGDVVVAFGQYGTSASVHFYFRSGSTFTLEHSIDVTFEANSRMPILAVSGQSAVVGLPYAPFGRTVEVWVRDQSSWTQQGTLDVGTSPNDLALAIDGEVAWVGSPGDSVLGSDNAGSAYVFQRSGTAWSRVAHLYDAHGILFNQFGSAIALGGETALIGSAGADTDAVRTGKVSVFESNGTDWIQGMDFADGNARADAEVGTSISVSGSTLAAGAPHARNAYGGAAFIFRQTGHSWQEQATLRPSNAISRGFGASIALDGDVAVVGANYEVAPGDGGAAYVYTQTNDTWQQSARLTASPSTNFGRSIALAGNWLAVGDPGAPVDISQSPPGNVHVFSGAASAWSEQALLHPSLSSENDQFGYALAMSGDSLIVGAPLADEGIETDAGAVFEFVNTGSGWSERAALTAPVIMSNGHFGQSVAIRGDTAVVGTGDNYYLSNGAAYVYTRSGAGWIWQATLNPSVSIPHRESYGYSVAISEDESRIVIGAPFAYQGSSGYGEAFVFVRDGDTWSASSVFKAPATADPPPYNQSDGFGLSLAFAGNDVAVGAPFDGTGGAVYVFSLENEIFIGTFDPVP